MNASNRVEKKRKINNADAKAKANADTKAKANADAKAKANADAKAKANADTKAKANADAKAKANADAKAKANADAKAKANADAKAKANADAKAKVNADAKAKANANASKMSIRLAAERSAETMKKVLRNQSVTNMNKKGIISFINKKRQKLTNPRATVYKSLVTKAMTKKELEKIRKNVENEIITRSL